MPCTTEMNRQQTVRSVAQPGSASGLGPEGREFESLHSDHFSLKCDTDGTEGVLAPIRVSLFHARFHRHCRLKLRQTGVCGAWDRCLGLAVRAGLFCLCGRDGSVHGGMGDRLCGLGDVEQSREPQGLAGSHLASSPPVRGQPASEFLCWSPPAISPCTQPSICWSGISSECGCDWPQAHRQQCYVESTPSISVFEKSAPPSARRTSSVSCPLASVTDTCIDYCAWTSLWSKFQSRNRPSSGPLEEFRRCWAVTVVGVNVRCGATARRILNASSPGENPNRLIPGEPTT